MVEAGCRGRKGSRLSWSCGHSVKSMHYMDMACSTSQYSSWLSCGESPRQQAPFSGNRRFNTLRTLVFREAAANALTFYKGAIILY